MNLLTMTSGIVTIDSKRVVLSSLTEKLILNFRYWAVTNIDYIHHRTGRRIGMMILVVWLVAALVCVAPLFGWKDPEWESRVLHGKSCLVSQDIGYQVTLKSNFQSTFPDLPQPGFIALQSSEFCRLTDNRIPSFFSHQISYVE